jgi:hypothetical protein
MFKLGWNAAKCEVSRRCQRSWPSLQRPTAPVNPRCFQALPDGAAILSVYLYSHICTLYPAACPAPQTTCRLCVGRIKLIRNKKAVQIKISQREIAEQLKAGKQEFARIRVEGVIREKLLLQVRRRDSDTLALPSTLGSLPVPPAPHARLPPSLRPSAHLERRLMKSWSCTWSSLRCVGGRLTQLASRVLQACRTPPAICHLAGCGPASPHLPPQQRYGLGRRLALDAS